MRVRCCPITASVRGDSLLKMPGGYVKPKLGEQTSDIVVGVRKGNDLGQCSSKRQALNDIAIQSQCIDQARKEFMWVSTSPASSAASGFKQMFSELYNYWSVLWPSQVRLVEQVLHDDCDPLLDPPS